MPALVFLLLRNVLPARSVTPPLYLLLSIAPLVIIVALLVYRLLPAPARLAITVLQALHWQLRMHASPRRIVRGQRLISPFRFVRLVPIVLLRWLVTTPFVRLVVFAMFLVCL
jgi:hypothetical protein